MKLRINLRRRRCLEDPEMQKKALEYAYELCVPRELRHLKPEELPPDIRECVERMKERWLTRYCEAMYG